MLDERENDVKVSEKNIFPLIWLSFIITLNIDIILFKKSVKDKKLVFNCLIYFVLIN